MNPFKIVRTADTTDAITKSKRKAIPKNLGLLDMISLAWAKPIAMVIGMIFGGSVSGGVSWVWHHEIHKTENYTWATFYDPRFVLVLAGMAYSLHSVAEITFKANGKRWKAIAFAVILESLMVLSSTSWITVAALCLVASLNALSAGLVLVRGSRADIVA